MIDKKIIQNIYRVFNTFLLIGLFSPLFFLYQYDGPSTSSFTITNSKHVSGIDVWCNDVYLGKTPVTIPIQDIPSMIPQWEEPPRQKHLTLYEKHESATQSPAINRYSYMHMTYSPVYFFSKANLHYDPRRINIRKSLKNAFYWLRYEKDGCIGLAQFKTNTTPRILSKNIQTIRFEPDISFPAQHHLTQHLLFSLGQTRFEPSPEWIDLASKYLGLVYLNLYWESNKDQRLKPALDAAVRAKYHITDNITQEDYESVVKNILDQAENSGYFEFPSPESDALTIAAPHALDYISDQYLQYIDYFTENTIDTGSLFFNRPLLRFEREGKAARLLPLEFTIDRFHPPRVFDRLVYESTRRRSHLFLRLIANYPTSEAKRIFEYHLSQYDPDQWYKGYYLFQLFPYIHNQELNDSMVAFVNRYARKDQKWTLDDFYISRLNQPDLDISQFIHSVMNSPIPVEDQLKVLAAIHHPSAYTQCLALKMDRNKFRFTLFDNYVYTNKHPWKINPQFEDYFIALCEEHKENDNPKEIRNLFPGLIEINTEKTRQYMKQISEKFFLCKESLIGLLTYKQWHDPILPDWTDYLSELTDTSLRIKATKALLKTGTPQSLAILDRWMSGPDPEISSAALEAIQEHSSMIETTQKLLSGEIHPDNLMGPAKSYIWNGEDYVPEHVDIILNKKTRPMNNQPGGAAIKALKEKWEGGAPAEQVPGPAGHSSPLPPGVAPHDR